MKISSIIIIVIVAVSVLVTQSARSQTKVGGGCAYDDFPGTCTVTEVQGDGTVVFTYEGSVDGAPVTLAGNTATSGGAVGTAVDCTLQFITSGTCTPCMISIGQCGSEAWSTFSTWAATQALSSGGCSLSAF